MKKKIVKTPVKKKKRKVASKIDELNIKREYFCKLYTSTEFFGNGVQAYIEAYNPDQSKPNWYKTAQGGASRLLSNAIILDRINELLDDRGLNDAFVDKQLLFLITQNVEFGAKAAAIREYNKLKQRIIEKSEVKILPSPIYGGKSRKT